MKKRGQRVEEHKEHKLREKGIVISPRDILKALKKFAAILPFSGTEELTLAKTKVTAEKEKIEQEIEKDVQKAKKIAHLNLQIEDIKKVIEKLHKHGVQDLEAIMRPSKPSRKDIQEMEAMITRKEKELAGKQEELQTLRSPSFKPLQPSEMVDALIYSPYRPNSLDEVLVKLDGLTAESSVSELIDTANSLISIARIEPLKSKIDSRKDFLKSTKGKLPLVTKLPNKPGDENNIKGFISSIRNLHGAFVAEQEINDQRIHFLQKSTDLLIVLRGYLKMWSNPELMPKTKQIDFSQGGIIGFLESLLSEVEEIVKSVRLLVKDFSLLYDFVEPNKSSPQNLMILLEENREILYKQKEFNYKKFLKAQDFYDLGFVRGKDGSVKREDVILQVERGELRKSGHEDLSKKNSDLLKYKADLEKIINLYIGVQSLIFIVMEYLDPEELPLNFSKEPEYLINSSLGKAKYYSEQLKYTDTAITSLTKMQTEHIAAKKFKNSLFSNIYQAIGDVFKKSIISIIKEYAYLSSSEILSRSLGDKVSKSKVSEPEVSEPEVSEPEVSKAEDSYYKRILAINNNIKFLAKAQNAIKFCYYLRTSGKVSELQEFLFNLNFINIKLSFSNGFTKLVNGKLSAVLFIDQMIKVATKITRFFDFNTVKKLETDKKLKVKVVKKIEDYIVKDLSLVIKSLVGRTIEQEHSLLDSFGYFIDHLDAEGTKNIKVPVLLNMLISLADCKPAVSKQLLNTKILDDLVKRALFEKENISKMLYDLVQSGHADMEIIDQFLKAGADINFVSNGKGYLHLIANKLTEVGREHQLNYKKAYDIPHLQQYKVDPDKQDKLIETALFLVEKGADIKLKNKDGSGFLTSLFGKLPGEQGRYLYLIFLKNENILKQLSLEDCDVYGRNLLHLLFRDMFDFFYNSSNKIYAKKAFADITRKIIGQENPEQVLYLQDKGKNTPLHYLAGSITEEFWNLKDTFGNLVELRAGLPRFKFDLLNVKNIYGETPLHSAFSKAGDVCAFFDFVLYRLCSPLQWHNNPEVSLHAKNIAGISVLDMIIDSNSQRIASAINAYLSNITYTLGIDRETGIREAGKLFVFDKDSNLVSVNVGLLDEHLPSELSQASEIIKTILLSYLYQTPQKDEGSSSCSSSSSSSSGSMQSSSSSISQVGLGSDGEVVKMTGSATGIDQPLSWHTVPVIGSSDKPLSGDNDSVSDH